MKWFPYWIGYQNGFYVKWCHRTKSEIPYSEIFGFVAKAKQATFRSTTYFAVEISATSMKWYGFLTFFVALSTEKCTQKGTLSCDAEPCHTKTNILFIASLGKVARNSHPLNWTMNSFTFNMNTGVLITQIHCNIVY